MAALNRIKFPNLDIADFGGSLAEQFRNIDLNFQKLANANLHKGEDGAGCTYITYNLNAIFFYRIDNDDSLEYNNFVAWTSWISNKASNPMYDRTEKLRAEVESDYEEFNKLTGGTRSEYAAMCAYLLFGHKSTFNSIQSVDAHSMLGALWNKYKKNDYVSFGDVRYYAMWLLKWYTSPLIKSDSSVAAAYKSTDARVKLFLDHMKLFDPGRIAVAVAPTFSKDKHAVGNYRPVGSLAYVYLDPRFRNNQTGTFENVEEWNGATEISCVLYWSPRPLGHMTDINGGFRVVNLFPQMRFDGDGLYWTIGGTDTNIPVSGPPGTAGKNAQFVVVERVGNVMGAVYDAPGYTDNSRLWGPWPLKGSVSYEDWAKSEKLIRMAHSGRAARNAKYGEVVQNFIDKNIYIKYDTSDTVVSSTISAENGWLVDGKGFNQTELMHLYRIYGIVGQRCFWRAKSGMKPIKDMPWRQFDPSYAEENYGDKDAIEVDASGPVQTMIRELDGAPCIVVADPTYTYDRTNTTVWFSTLKAVPAYSDKKDTLMLVAYCGDENQMATNIDDHSMAGLMQNLDAYSYKSTGSNRNKPRGLMLPIGSAMAVSVGKDTPASDIYGSHIIHSDLGGFKERGLDKDRNIYYGIVANPDKNQTMTSLLGNNFEVANKVLAGDAGDFPWEGQFAEVIGKRFMHIGSVNDYRTLDYVPMREDGTDVFNPGIPGREPVGANMEHGAPYGTPDYFGELLGDDDNKWFYGSELHIDEPVTITRYRDLHKKGTLFTVEGDAIIGPHRHVNFTNEFIHNYRAGGLFVQSTITDELIGNTEFWKRTVFDCDLFGKGFSHTFRSFTRDTGEWRAQLSRTIGDTDKYYDRRLGDWKDIDNKVDAIEPIHSSAGKNTRYSILADDGIGARVVTALDGIAVVNQTTDDKTDRTPFSVDAQGNIQTLGEEVRSNATDTFWAFHTRWPEENKAVPGTTLSKTPAPNELLFGTSHEVMGVNRDKNIHHWLEVGKVDNDILDTTYLGADKRTPRQLAAGYYTNLGFATTKDGKEQYGTAFNIDDDNCIAGFQGGKILPFITRLWCDLLYQEGALAVKGVHFLPVTTTFNGEDYYGRYGGNFEHGIVVGKESARSTLAAQDRTDQTDPAPLTAPYFADPNRTGTTYPNTDSTGAYYIDTDKVINENYWEDGDINMFNLPVDEQNVAIAASTPIGIWSRSGILSEESILAQKDLWVGRASSVRAQSRAMSFRRHKSAEWAFLLDDGKSSLSAPKVDWGKDDNTGYYVKPFDTATTSPITMDFGSYFKSHRLVRFGYSDPIYVGNNGQIVRGEIGDRQIILTNETLPFTNIKRRATGNMFAGDDYLPFTVDFSCLFGICVLQLRINVNKMSRSTDNWHGGWFHFGGQKNQYAYGISDKPWASSDAGYNDVYGGGNAPKDGYLRENPKRPLRFVGLNAAVALQIFQGYDYLKPDHEIWQFIGSTHGGNDSCAWYNNRDYQYGMWIKLDADGNFSSDIYNGNGALFDFPTTVTLTYTWAARLKDEEKFFEVCATNEDRVQGPDHKSHIVKTTVGKDSLEVHTRKTEEDANNVIEQLKYDDSNADSKNYYYIWKRSRTENGYNTNGNWELVWVYTTSAYEYILSEASTKADDYTDENQVPHTFPDKLKPNGGSIDNPKLNNSAHPDWGISEWLKAIQKYIASGKPEDDPGYSSEEELYQAFTNTTYKYLWVKETRTLANKPTVITSILYQFDASAIGVSTGLFAQNTKLGIVGYDKESGYFNKKYSESTTRRSVHDGMFRPMGAFKGWTDLYSNGVYVKSGGVLNDIKANTFSVNYFESGGMCYLRLRIALDIQDKWSDSYHSATWGIGGLKTEIVNIQETKAWLPTGAKLPEYLVTASFGGQSHQYRSGGDQDFTGGITFGLNSNGQVVIVSAFRPKQLIQRSNGSSQDDFMGGELNTACPMMEVLFIYKGTDKVMEDSHYDEQSSSVSGGDADKPIGGDGLDQSGDTTTQPSENWQWQENVDTVVTAESVKAWLKDDKRKELKARLKSAVDNKIGGVMTANYGTATIEYIDNPISVSASMIISSYNNGSTDLSHRSLNFLYKKNGSDFDIELRGTYLIKIDRAAGYYYATKATIEGSKITSVDGISWIGTERGDSHADATKPYILSWSGTEWKMVDAYINETSDKYYFLAMAIASNASANDGIIAPGGFVAWVGSDDKKTFQAPKGEKYFLPLAWVGDDETTIHGSEAANFIINTMRNGCDPDTKTPVSSLKNWEPNKVPKTTAGYPYLFSIKGDELRRDSFKTVTLEAVMSSSSFTPNQIFTRETPIKEFRNNIELQWMNENNDTSEKMVFDLSKINNWTGNAETAMRLFLSNALKYVITDGKDSMREDEYDERLNAVYSDETGWTAGWHQFLAEGAIQSMFKITSELSSLNPTTDDGLGSKVGLRCGGTINAQFEYVNIHGKIDADCTGFEWGSGLTGVTGGSIQTQYPYLVSRWNIGSGIYKASKVHRLPYINNINGNLIVTDDETGNRWRINYQSGSTKITQI